MMSIVLSLAPRPCSWVTQEHVFQPYEDVLPYETFSLR